MIRFNFSDFFPLQNTAGLVTSSISSIMDYNKYFMINEMEWDFNINI